MALLFEVGPSSSNAPARDNALTSCLGMSNLSRVEALTREVPAPESSKTSRGQSLYVAVMVQGVPTSGWGSILGIFLSKPGKKRKSLC